MIEKNETPKSGDASVLEGIIIPRAWDEKGLPTEFSLFTFDEGEYWIDPHRGKGPEASAFIRRTVQVMYRRDEKKLPPGWIVPDEILEVMTKE